MDLDAEPDDPRYPQGCLDESPVQLTRETRHPLPARPGHPERDDPAAKREGPAHLFWCVQPWRGWRHGNVTTQRTKPDFAQPLRVRVDPDFPTAERIRRVVDPLNGHFISLTPPWMKVRYRPEECLPKVAVGMVVRLRPQHEPVVLTCTSDCCL